MRCYTGHTHNGAVGVVAAPNRREGAKAARETQRDFNRFWQVCAPVEQALSSPLTLFERPLTELGSPWAVAGMHNG